MKVAELIKVLLEMPQDADVVAPIYCDGWYDGDYGDVCGARKMTGDAEVMICDDFQMQRKID